MLQGLNKNEGVEIKCKKVESAYNNGVRCRSVGVGVVGQNV